MDLRSRNITLEPPQRALLKGVGLSDEDLELPLIGIANSFSELSPGHIHLRTISDYVRRGIRYAGGTPLEFNTIALCDGLSGAFVRHKEAQRYTLPHRDLIADSVEMAIEANQLDGLVAIGTCDKIVPGMLMACARLGIPAIFVFGGSMLPGRYKGRVICGGATEMIEATGQYKAGALSKEDMDAMVENACPTPGACGAMVTGNSMGVIAEALGMGLPGSGTVPALDMRQLRLAELAGRRIVSLVRAGITARDVISREAMENAIRVLCATGGSTNCILHIMAISREAGLDVDLDLIDELSRRTPHLCPLIPSGEFSVPEFHDAGGVQGVMKRLAPLLHLDCMTVTGETLGKNLERAEVRDERVIRPLHDPYKPEGGIAVLKGNLAPEGAVVKQSAVSERMQYHVGRARVFDSEEDATEAVLAGKVHEGEVVVVRYEGPKGGPGMREMTTVIGAIWGKGLQNSVSLITDGRFSGAIRGPAIGYISPEAAEGGPLGVIEDGDLIEIDIPRRKLEVRLDEAQIRERLARWTRPAFKVERGCLRMYERFSSSANKGAVIEP
ncbi:MAG TPA: dihydroxy-acid dehydratase [Firmicutes bacterium]|mgnify:CR=1 FL=1|nr:dihydroxy-acid dehydratase [Bacillota bacterium]